MDSFWSVKHHFFAAVFARNQHRVEWGYAEKHYLLKYLKKKKDILGSEIGRLYCMHAC